MMYDVCIIGAGPAGISSAIYAASRGMKTIVFEEKRVGGVLAGVSTVTHYAGIVEAETGSSFAERLKKQAESAGVTICMEKVDAVQLVGDVKQIRTAQNQYESTTVILAAGTTPKKLGIPGEEEFAGKGIGMNAASSAEAYKGKEMFVVGGADGAVKEAIYLANYASKVTIIHFEDQLGAIAEFKEKIKQNDKIELKLHSRLIQVEGSQQVDRLVLQDEHTKERHTIDSAGCAVFIYAGSVPNTQMFCQLENRDGYLVTDEKQQTKIAGVYAAGDITAKQIRQAATAVSDGAIAGINAALYCSNF